MQIKVMGNGSGMLVVLLAVLVLAYIIVTSTHNTEGAGGILSLAELGMLALIVLVVYSKRGSAKFEGDVL